MSMTPIFETTHIRLLGGFAVSVGDAVVPDDAFRLRKAKSLLKLLALAPDRRMHRARIGELLWPDREVDSVSNNLHQALYSARRALESVAAGAGALLSLHDDSLSLGGQGLPKVEVDVDAFETAVVRARAERTAAAYGAAIERYGGELLPEDRGEHWSIAQRQALRELYITLLIELCELHAGEGRRAAAVDAAQRAVLEHPLHEGAQRALMRSFVADGRRQQALEQYAQLRELLRRELEARPDPETRQLYQEILTRSDAEPAQPAARPPAPARSVRGRLPAPLTSFIGRTRECAEVKSTLARVRLLTLSGPGGCGKTRLALEVAAALDSELPNGVLLVELAGLTDPALVAHEVASALAIELRSEREPVSVIAEQIGDQDTLLVLDNCEHVLAGCAQFVQRLLGACPRLRVLATSREPLHVLGESSWRVPSLSLPDVSGPLDLEQLSAVEAVQLFVARASSVAPGFALQPDNAAAIAEVCLRLDGMPLAIELAAARSAALSPAQIAARLRDSALALGQGNRGALTRQQTLTATIDWSYQLLDAQERALFRRLSVFAGSFALEAVESIAAGDGLGRAEVADLLARLVDKSLVLAADEAGERRYRLLETVKQYGAARLADEHELAPLEERFLAFYLALAADNDPDAGCAAGFAGRLEREHDNLRVALASALAKAGDRALRLCSHLCAFWMAYGYFAEGTAWLDKALALVPEPTSLRARALLHRAGLAVRRGQVDRIRPASEESGAILRGLGDLRALADARQQAAMFECLLGAPAEAERVLEHSRELAERLGDASAIAAVQYCAGVIAYSYGEYERAEAALRAAFDSFAALPSDDEPVFATSGIGLLVVDEQPGRPRCYFEETFLVFRKVQPRAAAGWALANLSAVQRSAGRLEDARGPLEQALALFEQQGDTLGWSMALNLAGNLARSRGEFERGRLLLEQAIAMRRELRDRRGTGLSLANLGLLEARAGQRERAARLLQQAHELFTRTEDMPGLTAVQMVSGSIALLGGDFAAARRALEHACALSVQQAGTRPAGWLAVTLAEAALEQGERADAARYLSQAREWFAAARDARAERRIAALDAASG